MSLTRRTKACGKVEKTPSLRLEENWEPDAWAILGHEGARVALLQSPILPRALKN